MLLKHFSLPCIASVVRVAVLGFNVVECARRVAGITHLAENLPFLELVPVFTVCCPLCCKCLNYLDIVVGENIEKDVLLNLVKFKDLSWLCRDIEWL